MEGCVAPSEVPGVSSNEARIFGGIAEEIIYADFTLQNKAFFPLVFFDNYNQSAYLYFLAFHNTHFTEALQKDYYKRTRKAGIRRIPDLCIHTKSEKSFYEIKPYSKSGVRAGIEKVAYLSATYKYYNLPYRAGTKFAPRDHLVASLGTSIKATLRVNRIGPGLIAYKLCLSVKGVTELVTLLILLKYIINEINKQSKRPIFAPVDLKPLFSRNQELAKLAKALGLTFAVAAAAVGWKHFWKAVVKRFAVRGVAAATMSAADGPLPVGELLSLGLGVLTIIDVIRLSDELWDDAAKIARKESA